MLSGGQSDPNAKKWETKAGPELHTFIRFQKVRWNSVIMVLITSALTLGVVGYVYKATSRILLMSAIVPSFMLACIYIVFVLQAYLMYNTDNSIIILQFLQYTLGFMCGLGFYFVVIAVETKT